MWQTIYKKWCRTLVTCLVKKAAMMAKDFLNIFFNQLSSIASVDHDEVGQQFWRAHLYSCRRAGPTGQSQDHPWIAMHVDFGSQHESWKGNNHMKGTYRGHDVLEVTWMFNFKHWMLMPTRAVAFVAEVIVRARQALPARTNNRLLVLLYFIHFHSHGSYR